MPKGTQSDFGCKLWTWTGSNSKFHQLLNVGLIATFIAPANKSYRNMQPLKNPISLFLFVLRPNDSYVDGRRITDVIVYRCH